MLTGLIAPYLDKRMQELGYCKGYAMRVRHFVIHSSGMLTIQAWNEVFVLAEDAQDLRIESDLGIYDTGTPDITSEQQHEHSGLIILTNLTADCACHVQFVQAIPLEDNSHCTACNPTE